jgi:hypothetical protein
MSIQVSLKLEISATASLQELEGRMQEAGQQAIREGLKQALRQVEDQQTQCPHCGQSQRRLEGTVRRVVSTVFGRVSVPRRRFRCLSCGQRCAPANRLFAGLRGSIIRQPLREAALLASSSWLYRVASQLLAKLSGAQISAEEIRRLSNERGKHRATEQQAEAACLTTPPQISSEETGKPSVLVGIDGGWVCSREQRGGMEGQVAVICSQVQDLPMPNFSTTFSWRKTRRAQASTSTTPSPRWASLCRHLCILPAARKACGSGLHHRGGRPKPTWSGDRRWGPLDPQSSKLSTSRTPPVFWIGHNASREIRHAVSVAARAKGLSQRQRDYQMYLHRTWLWRGKRRSSPASLAYVIHWASR